MPFGFAVIGLILIISGLQNTYAQLGAQLQKDFSGRDSFMPWIVVLGGVGATGYVERLRPVATAFMTLLVLVMFLAAKGFFPKLDAALKQGAVAPTATPVAAAGLTGALGNTLSNATSTLGGYLGVVTRIPSFLQGR
jgi:hypothetical protein